jgi:hypothetical protein
MRQLWAIAALVAVSSASADDTKQHLSPAQTACAIEATKIFREADAALQRKAAANTANDQIMSVDDTIAQRRLVEGFCKQWSACLVNDIDAKMKETVYRWKFASCLDVTEKATP